MCNCIKIWAFLVCCAVLAMPCRAQLDYSSLNGLKSDALALQVNKLIATHTRLSYEKAWTVNSRIDVAPKDYIVPNGCVVDMYSDCELGANKNCNDTNFTTTEFCECYSREHSLPKSWWGGSTSEPMYTDVVHLIPTDNATNQKRWYYPYGEPTSTSWSNNVGAKLGRTSAYGSRDYVFMPNPEYKGDIARIYFYMITCYRNKNFTSNAQARRVMTYTNGVAGFKSAFLDLLLKWHRNDPVSDWEKTRNNRIQEVQGNRNPFVDLPDLVEYIWGNKKGQVFT